MNIELFCMEQPLQKNPKKIKSYGNCQIIYQNYSEVKVSPFREKKQRKMSITSAVEKVQNTLR